MTSLVFLIPLSLVLGGVALAAFLWSVESGQYEDLDGAAQRILLDEENDQAMATTRNQPPASREPAR